MMLSGDYIIASDEAKLIAAYTASGLTPDGSMTALLAKHVGLLRAKELIFTNRALSAAEALDWGLVTKVVPAADLAATGAAVARQFAQGPTLAFGEAKRLLNRTYSAATEAQLEAETRAIAGIVSSEDTQGAIRSFLAKEQPRFEGK